MAKFLKTSGRAGLRGFLDGAARGLLRIGLTANAMTFIGTAVIVAASVWLIPSGHLVAATIVITCAAFTDLFDGAMARLSGKTSRFGALLDSTMDRVADGAVLAGIAFYLLRNDMALAGAFALWCLIASEVVSYVKARSESLGTECPVGIVERPERLIGVGLVTIAAVAGVPYAWEVGLGLLGVLSTVTVAQRLIHSHKAMSEDEAEDSADARQN
ncbi:phosphatidylinositol phosphate synthase [Salininema proteolyticum]|uniref:Phosphatidylinositol phosphate synthase n=1 Tax=Salininema proteolyticum TaxID=1607685 RepID=A0ABV8U424_9ACTN